MRSAKSQPPGPSWFRWLKRQLLFLLLIIVGLLLTSIISMRWVNPVTSSIMIQHNLKSPSGTGSRAVHYQWVDWHRISQHMALAVLAAEDQRFFEHWGIDFRELGKAIRQDADKRRGASTITQQVAKNLYLWGGRSYVRKGMEAILALLIEACWSKQRILEVYLNIAQFGSNIYGVEQASQRFFDRAAARLNRDQAARLAAVLPSPVRFSATHPSRYVIQRQRWILKQMQQLERSGIVDSL